MRGSIELLRIQRSFLWGNASVWLVRRLDAFRPGGEGNRLFNCEESGACRQGQRFRKASVLPDVKHWAAPTCSSHMPATHMSKKLICNSSALWGQAHWAWGHPPTRKILFHYAEMLCTSPAKHWVPERALTHSLPLWKKSMLQHQCSAEEQLWMRRHEVIRKPVILHSGDMGQVKQRTWGYQQRDQARKTKQVTREKLMKSESLATP